MASAAAGRALPPEVAIGHAFVRVELVEEAVNVVDAQMQEMRAEHVAAMQEMRAEHVAAVQALQASQGAMEARLRV